ncbi:hypothetical protein [Propionibacterium freudenreichii]|uniref:hypothetical protein n=1 Tax=Propionibacterium freudenreichii TaxID=1744 RepID=UPI0021A5EA4F|nr:hypothetical protein [Propionibacterium freudenreichii]
MVELRLEIDKGREADAARFFGAGQKLLDALDSLAETPTDWRLSELRLGSAVAAIGSSTDDLAGPIPKLMRGLRLVTENKTPPDWAPDTFAEARAVTEFALGEATSTLTLVGSAEADKVVYLNDHLAKLLRQLQPTTRTIPGSIRGTVTGVNVSRGNRASIRLQGNGRTVRVSLSDALRESFKEALYGFVEVIGEIRQDHTGRPFHITAQSLRLIPEPATNWSDLLGIDPDATDGMPVLEYLRRIRGE